MDVGTLFGEAEDLQVLRGGQEGVELLLRNNHFKGIRALKDEGISIIEEKINVLWIRSWDSIYRFKKV